MWVRLWCHISELCTLQALVPEDFLLFPIESFVVLHFPYKSGVHFKFIFVKSMKFRLKVTFMPTDVGVCCSFYFNFQNYPQSNTEYGFVVLHSWPLNNTALNCTGTLTCRFLLINILENISEISFLPWRSCVDHTRPP